MKVPLEKKYREASLSAFRRAVYDVVARIPRGRVMTYATVAKEAGYSRAVRAVGTALSKNCYQDVPCHRVIRSDGLVGEYAFGGPLIKQKRLGEEGVLFDTCDRAIFPL